MKNRLVLAIFACFILFQTHALVSLGGYVPFGTSTQKDVDGGKNTFSFDPMLSFNAIVPAFWGQLFLPEIGLVFHGTGQDDYSKRTTLLLLDMGHPLGGKYVLRYGIGTVLTKIKGDGGTVRLRNGSQYQDFYRPSKSVTSWNTTLDLGVEHAINKNYAVRFQTFWFSLLSSTSRKASYALNITYYL